MGSKLNPLLVIFTLSCSFPLVDSAGLRTLYWKDFVNESNLSHPKSNDIQSIINSLELEKSRHLEVLFDDKFADLFVTLSPILSNKPPGTKLYRYEEQPDKLQQILTMSSKERVLLLVICSADNIVKIFQTIKAKRMESHFIQWVLVTYGGDESQTLMLHLEGLIFEGTQVLVASRETGGKILLFSTDTDVSGIQRFHRRGGLDSGSLTKRLESPASGNMEGRDMTVTAVEVYPFIGFKEVRPDGTVEPTFGTDVLLLEALSHSLNFTYRIVPSPDGTWGIPQPDGNISGVVGMVARREASLAIGGNVMNDARETVIDYTTWYSQGYLKIFSSAPKEKNQALALLFTFSFEVWLCIVLAVVGVGSFLVLQAKILATFRDNVSSDVQKYYFSVFGSIVVQCNLMIIKDWSQRMTFFSWYVFCLVVVALYAGMLTAVLAVPEFETPVDSLTHLARAVQKGFTLGVTRESSNEYIFRDATEGIYKEVWGLFNHEDRSKSFVPSPSIGMKKILEEKFIFIWFETLGKNFASGLGSYKFHISRESFFPQSFAYPIPPGAPYRESFNRVIMRIVEGGIMAKWQEDAFRRNTKPKSGDEKTFTAISLKHLQAAFIVLLLGFLISFAVLSAEKLMISCGR